MVLVDIEKGSPKFYTILSAKAVSILLLPGNEHSIFDPTEVVLSSHKTTRKYFIGKLFCFCVIALVYLGPPFFADKEAVMCPGMYGHACERYTLRHYEFYNFGPPPKNH